VGVVLVLAHERYKGGTRVHFACGFRALAHARTRGERLEQAGVILSAAPEAVPEAAQRLKDQLAEEQERGQQLLRRAIEGEARSLVAARAPGDPVVAVYENWPPADLRALAQRVVALDRCVALLGSAAGKAHAVFAQSEGLPFDVGGLLRDAMQAIGGRGGGRGNLAQGGGESAEGLAAALESAARRVREQSR
jgi:alanyl-tRNA synthetase